MDIPTKENEMPTLTAAADLQALAIAGSLAQNAEPFKSWPHGDGWIAEPKYDGWRIIAVVGDDHVDLYSRSGKSYNGKLPKVEAELLAALPAGTIIDGEAVALRIEGDKVINEWGTAQTVMSKLGGHAAADRITFMAFDLIAHAGIDARALPYEKRRALLERIFDANDFEAVQLTIQVEPDQGTFEFMLMQGFEGLILKRDNAAYTSGGRNGAGWMKVKGVTTVEVVVTGFKPGKDGFEGMIGAVEFGQFKDGELIGRGRCSGMDMRTRLDMTHNPDKWVGTVIEIAHMGVSIGKTDTGSFRHPQFKRRRPDKAPAQVEWHDA